MGLEPWTRYILGFSLGEKSPQWQESEKFIHRIQQGSDAIAKKTLLQDEVIMNDKPDERSAIVQLPAEMIPRITRVDRQAFRG